jgi:hypothetical protein
MSSLLPIIRGNGKAGHEGSFPAVQVGVNSAVAFNRTCRKPMEILEPLARYEANGKGFDNHAFAVTSSED